MKKEDSDGKYTEFSTRAEKANEIVKIYEDGDIQGGPYEGLNLRCLLEAMRDSAWDWPSACGVLGLLQGFDETMYPGEAQMAYLKELCPNENWDDFNMSWDT